MILEINSCKHANNIQIDDLCYYVAKALFELPLLLGIKSNSEPPAQFDYIKTIQSQVNKTCSFFENYFKNSKKSQRIFVDSMFDFFIEAKPVKLENSELNLLETSFVRVLHYLYNDFEFLSEEVILEWYQDKEKRASTSTPGDEDFDADEFEKTKIAVKKLKPFIDWLKEDENDDDDEDEDDEDDDDDDEDD